MTKAEDEIEIDEIDVFHQRLLKYEIDIRGQKKS